MAEIVLHPDDYTTCANGGTIVAMSKMIKQKDARIHLLEEALRGVLVDLADYERVNNLSPSPGKQFCWQSVTTAHAALAVI